MKWLLIGRTLWYHFYGEEEIKFQTLHQRNIVTFCDKKHFLQTQTFSNNDMTVNPFTSFYRFTFHFETLAGVVVHEG